MRFSLYIFKNNYFSGGFTVKEVIAIFLEFDFYFEKFGNSNEKFELDQYECVQKQLEDSANNHCFNPIHFDLVDKKSKKKFARLTGDRYCW